MHGQNGMSHTLVIEAESAEQLKAKVFELATVFGAGQTAPADNNLNVAPVAAKGGSKSASKAKAAAAPVAAPKAEEVDPFATPAKLGKVEEPAQEASDEADPFADPIPEAPPVEEKITPEQVREALQKVHKEVNMDAVKAILREVGVPSVHTLTADHYPKVMELAAKALKAKKK